MSPNVPGQLLIWLAFAFNAVVGYSFWMLARGDRSYEGLARRSYNMLMAIILLASAYLYYLFFTHNYAIKYVYEYSDKALPFFYLLSSFWGGQEGTYLLWMTFNVAFGYLILKRAGRYRNWAMVVYSSINVFFLLMMIKLSPFALLEFWAPDGAGLNPLLQDPWMVVHPPVIFVGYSMVGVPFAIAMAALIMNDYGDWLKRALPWTAIVALSLGAGNILGAYWAYRTLGWGGFWGWDPVENSSFIPWFVSLALIHGLLIERRTGALRRINILLTAAVFLLVVYGTFLTRSGVLADFSVHSFVDLGINNYLVAFMVFFTGMTTILATVRFRSMKAVPIDYNYYGREFSLFLGMSLLFAFSIVILFWTSLPILTTIFTDEPRAADVATYNQFAGPFAILFSLYLAAAPFLTFAGHKLKNWIVKFVPVIVGAAFVGFGALAGFLGETTLFAAVFTLGVAGLLMYMFKADLVRQMIPSLIAFGLTVALCIYLGIENMLYIMFLSTAVMAIVSNLIALTGKLPGGWRTAGGVMTHFGFGIMIVGILGSSAFATNKKLVIPQDDTREAYGLEIGFHGMEHGIEYPKNRLLLTYQENGVTHDARPELYYSRRLNGIMRKPFVKCEPLYDLYFSPEQVKEAEMTGGLILRKGEKVTLGDYQVKFVGYNMPQHGSQEGAMAIEAMIDIETADGVERVTPTRVAMDGSEGSNTFMDMPAEFANGAYTITISQILANQGSVGLEIPGLTDKSRPARLIIDVSKKPLMILVWIGTTLILMGCIIMFIRRRAELYYRAG